MNNVQDVCQHKRLSVIVESISENEMRENGISCYNFDVLNFRKFSFINIEVDGRPFYKVTSYVPFILKKLFNTKI